MHETRRSIVTAVSWRLLALLAVVIVCAEGLHWIKGQRQADPARQSAARALAESGAALLATPGGDINPDVCQRWARAALRSPSVLLVAVVGSDGRCKARFPDTATTLAEVATRAAGRDYSGPTDVSIAGQRLRLSVAVNPIGSSAAPDKLVVLTQAERRPASVTAWIASILGPTLLAFAGMWLGAHWLRSYLGLALERLTANVDENTLAAWQRIADQRNDELGRIAGRMHDTTVELGRACDRVVRLEKSLDRRVLDHTRDMHAALKRTEKQVWIDSLTQLGNRRLLDERLEGIYNAQHATGGDLTLVMFDVDNFKAYNDRHGHLAGDELLKFVGELLRGALRSTDVGIRYGGDEFVVLLVDMEDKGGRGLAERIVRLFNQRTAMLASDPPVTMSAGVASLRTDSPTSGAQLLELADKALYAGKRAGKNRAASHAERPATVPA